MARNILLPIGDGTEMMDTLYPVFRLAEEGYEVVVAGPEVRTYHGVMHEIPPLEPIPWDITREQPAYHIRTTVAFRDINPADYDGLFLSGGRAPEYLRYDQDLLRIVKHFFDLGKPVAIVCHGVELAAAAGCLSGRTATTVGKCELDITQFGGIYVDEPFVTDGNLLSCRTWHDYALMFKPLLQLLQKQQTLGNGAKEQIHA
ncbi:DJ-1/PfpI family protein [Blastopirellula sp. J2-11]|uniref:DJ-1/PfpI family protein n=1 Tax=Blastopirellula sp. J2-11 TaxID=2943192 RepID=UPI0021C81E63|nr:DJ-1/PfpI family protein [Blastopirellula sp. J2-11]UUO07729.1 DJ-1/PfpI family protein [Blastopirellula sp. J2-11]